MFSLQLSALAGQKCYELFLNYQNFEVKFYLMSSVNINIGQHPRKPTQSRTVPRFVEQGPKNMEHLPKKWNG